MKPWGTSLAAPQTHAMYPTAKTRLSTLHCYIQAVVVNGRNKTVYDSLWYLSARNISRDASTSHPAVNKKRTKGFHRRQTKNTPFASKQDESRVLRQKSSLASFYGTPMTFCSLPEPPVWNPLWWSLECIPPTNPTYLGTSNRPTSFPCPVPTVGVFREEAVPQTSLGVLQQ